MINKRARLLVDTMTDELKDKGIVRRFMQKLHSTYQEEYRARHPETARERKPQDSSNGSKK